MSDKSWQVVPIGSILTCYLPCAIINQRNWKEVKKMKAKHEKRYEKMKEHVPEEAREHYKKARKEMRESIKALFPPEFIERRRAARKEMLLAAQKMISHAIERIEQKDA
jgi:hypothetical protein